jgi:hypothetical protein
MNGGMVTFFVILAVVLVVLVVLGGCYGAKNGRIAKFLQNLTRKKSASVANAPSSRKTAAKTGRSVASAAKPVRNTRRRVAFTSTGSSGSASASATTVRGGAGLTASHILDVGAQVRGVSGRNQQIAFAAGGYLPTTVHQSTASAEQTRQASLRALQGNADRPPGHHNTVQLELASTHGTTGYPNYQQ